MSIYFNSFEEVEINDILCQMQAEEINLGPPPMKRAKTESASTSTAASTISLYHFLSTPHNKTRHSFVEVTYLILCIIL